MRTTSGPGFALARPRTPTVRGSSSRRSIPGGSDQDPYPLPFHPLDLGQAALRHLFGFVTDGPRRPDDVPAGEVDLLGFRVTDPTGAEQADRAAVLQMIREAIGNESVHSLPSSM